MMLAWQQDCYGTGRWRFPNEGATSSFTTSSQRFGYGLGMSAKSSAHLVSSVGRVLPDQHAANWFTVRPQQCCIDILLTAVRQDQAGSYDHIHPVIAQFHHQRVLVPLGRYFWGGES